jgi:chloramphenicol-sensitive protein RarD
VDAVRGLALESTIVLPVAIVYLAWCEWRGIGAMGHGSTGRDLLLIAGGAVTAVPLVLFAYGARRVALSSLGLLQYVAPTTQLLLGVFAFHESFAAPQFLAFGCIWLALLLVMVDNLRRWLGRNGAQASVR